MREKSLSNQQYLQNCYLNERSLFNNVSIKVKQEVIQRIKVFFVHRLHTARRYCNYDNDIIASKYAICLIFDQKHLQKMILLSFFYVLTLFRV